MKWVIALIVVVVLGGGAWWYFNQPAPSEDMDATGGTERTTQSPNEPAGSSATAQTHSQAQTQTSGSGSIDQDTANIDAQLNGLDSDSASINSTQNDQPIDQTY